jgi:hypothetical protein
MSPLAAFEAIERIMTRRLTVFSVESDVTVIDLPDAGTCDAAALCGLALLECLLLRNRESALCDTLYVHDGNVFLRRMAFNTSS